MTWKEFKDRVEAQGVEDNHEIWMIDLTGWFDVDDIKVSEADASPEEPGNSIWDIYG